MISCREESDLLFSVETENAAEIVDAAQETAKWKEMAGELQSSNVRNGKMTPRFLLQPSCSTLNTQASKNLGRETSESLLCLFLSLTFSAFLGHPLERFPRQKHVIHVHWARADCSPTLLWCYSSACRCYSSAKTVTMGLQQSTRVSGFLT